MDISTSFGMLKKETYEHNTNVQMQIRMRKIRKKKQKVNVYSKYSNTYY